MSTTSTPITLRRQATITYPPAPADRSAVPICRVFFYQEAGSGFNRGAMELTGYTEYHDREAAENAASQWEGRL